MDLGFHIKADGESWRFLKISGPGGLKVLDLQNKQSMRRTGGSEFFLEGAEPEISEVPIAETLAKFPAGTYVFVGQTVDGEHMQSQATLTHVVPAGPEIVSVSVGPSFVITWNGVTARHPDFPNPAGPITIDAYQVIVDTFQVTLPHTGPGPYTLTLPPEFVATLGSGAHGFEVLAIEQGGKSNDHGRQLHASITRGRDLRGCSDGTRAGPVRLATGQQASVGAAEKATWDAALGNRRRGAPGNAGHRPRQKRDSGRTECQTGGIRWIARGIGTSLIAAFFCSLPGLSSLGPSKARRM